MLLESSVGMNAVNVFLLCEEVFTRMCSVARLRKRWLRSWKTCNDQIMRPKMVPNKFVCDFQRFGVKKQTLPLHKKSYEDNHILF